MKKTSGFIINTLRVFSFWGCMFLLLFTLGFSVTPGEMTEALGKGGQITAIVLYLFASVVLFLLFILLWILRVGEKKASRFDVLCLQYYMVLWPPYRALYYKPYVRIFNRGKSYMTSRERENQAGIQIWTVILFVIWWVMVILGALYLAHGTDPVSLKIQSLPSGRVWTAVGVAAAVCLIQYLISRILLRNLQKRSRGF